MGARLKTTAGGHKDRSQVAAMMSKMPNEAVGQLRSDLHKPAKYNRHGCIGKLSYRKALLMTPVSFLLAAFISSTLFAQSADSFDWFPYKKGDMWEYLVWEFSRYDTLQIISIKDSVSADGKIHIRQHNRLINPITMEYSLPYAIDTASEEVIQLFQTDPPRSTNIPIYKFRAQKGEQWVIFDHSSIGGMGYEMSRIKNIYDGNLFGRNTTFMEINSFFTQDSTDTLGLDRQWITLAKGFGKIYHFEFEGGYWYRIRGAVIDGVLFGDTTTLVTSVDTQPANGTQKNFELKQNYPNPFTSHTLIRFSLPRKEYVSLTIHDVIGRVVRTLIPDHEFSGGEHFLFWNGRDDKGEQVPHGMYMIHLRGNGYTLKRKAIVINE